MNVIPVMIGVFTFGWVSIAGLYGDDVLTGFLCGMVWGVSVAVCAFVQAQYQEKKDRAMQRARDENAYYDRKDHENTSA